MAVLIRRRAIHGGDSSRPPRGLEQRHDRDRAGWRTGDRRDGRRGAQPGSPLRNLAHSATLVIETEPALRPDIDPSWADRPGTGNCTRTDGATGPIETLIPDGWVLRDLGLTVRTPSGNSQVYVLLEPTGAATALDHIGYVDWVIEDGDLLLALVDGDPPVTGRERLSTLVFHDED